MTVLPVPFQLTQVGVAGSGDGWRSVGFDVSTNGLLSVLNGALAFTGSTDTPRFIGIGVEGGSLVDGANVEGVPVTRSPHVPPVHHPNGCFELDHLVMVTPNLDETSQHVTAVLGLRQLRVRETADVRQAFHRFADVTHPDGSHTRGCILELVESATATSTALAGVVFNTSDLDAVVANYSRDVIGEAKPAVQEGRQIAAFREGAGLGVRVALMTPVIPRGDSPAG